MATFQTLTSDQSNKYETINENMYVSEVLTKGVNDRNPGGPPGGPADMDAYIVDAATGVWTGFTINNIAWYRAGWRQIEAREGMKVYVNDENATYVFDGAAWVPSGTGTVTGVSVVSANGFAGSVANPSTSPAITISTSITGALVGNGTSISADAGLTSLSAFPTVADRIVYSTGADAWSETVLTGFMRTVLSAVDAQAARATLDTYSTAEIDSLLGGTSFDLFLSNTASDIGGYYAAYSAPTGEAESSFSVVITGSAVAIEEFASTSGNPGASVLVAGVYTLHLHAAKTAGSPDITIFAQFYSRTTGGAETLRATSETTANLAGSNTEYELTFTIPADVTINTTDRLVVKILGNKVGGGADPTATIYLEGTTASRFTFKTTSAVSDVRYLVKAGLAGGQIVYGGTGSGDGIAIYSTSNAIKGSLNFADLLYVNEASGYVAIGQSSGTAVINGVTVTGRHSSVVDNSQVQYAEGAFKRAENSLDFVGATGAYLRSRGTIASPTVVQNGDRIMSILALGYDGTDYAYCGSMGFDVGGTPGAGDMPGSFFISLSPDGGEVPEEAFRIKADKAAVFQGKVGVGTATPTSPMHILSTVTGASTNTLYVDGTYITASSAALNTRSFYVEPGIRVDSGVTQSGSVQGGYIGVLRNSRNGSDTGTLTSLYGIKADWGHYNTDSSTPTTTSAYGLYFQPYAKSGVISNLYSFYVAPRVTGGTVTNGWNLYIADTANNYIAGNIGIGQASFGASAAKTIAVGSGTAPTSSITDGVQLWAGDADGVAGNATLLMRNEGYSGTQTVSSVIVKDTAGDPSGTFPRGTICDNEFDKTIKMYAGGAWRTLTTW